MPALRNAAIVAGLRRRLEHADAATLTNFAWFAARRGGGAAALEAAQRASRLRGAPVAAQRAVERLSDGRLDDLLLTPLSEQEAEIVLPAPVARPPAFDESAVLQQGRQLLEQGRLAEALLAFERVLAVNAVSAVARFHRGVVLAKLRRYREALHDWESVGHADPDGRLGAMSRRHARSARELAALFGAR